MPHRQRHPTRYQGVVYINGICPATGKPDRIYHIRYRRNGKLIEETAGRAALDRMTPFKANALRTQKILGKVPTNAEKRAQEETQKRAEADKITIARLWDLYRENNPNLKGYVTDANRFELYLDPEFGTKTPAELLPLDVDRLRIGMLKSKAPQTVRNTLELLRRIINFGVNRGLCPALSFKIVMPKVDNIKTEDLSPKQLTKLLRVIDKATDRTAADMMSMALYTGMRRGEMFRLQWADIDWHRGFIHIKDPKGGKSQDIPMNEPTRKLLEARSKTESPYVFPGRFGGKRADIKKAVNKIRDAAGLPPTFRALHGLRHVHASLLASSGQVDLFTIQRLLTHKSSSMTQRYAHLRDEALKRASELAGDLINQAVKTKTGGKGVELESQEES